jgi:hypothetical protein
VAQKKHKKEDNERAVDIEALDTPLKKTAHHLGFHQRVSPNKIDRGLKHERSMKLWSWGFAGGMGLVTAIFASLRAWGPEERHGAFLGVALFASLWSFLSAVYARRSHNREIDFLELQAVVNEKLRR